MKNNAQPYVCLNCIGNEDYKTFIKEEGIKRKKCAYCKKQRTCVDLDLLADKIDEEYRANYVPSNSDDCGELPSEIISQMMELDDLEKLTNDLVDVLSEREYRDVNQGVDAFYDNGSLYVPNEENDYGNVLDHIETWDSFCCEIKHKTRFFNNKLIQSLNSLFSGLDTFDYKNKKPIRIIEPNNLEEAVFYRARYITDSHDKIYSNPSIELGPPPPFAASSGRMNPVGVSVFYGAFERKTCIAEIRIPVGEIAISDQFKLEKPITVLDLTALDEIEELQNPRYADDNQLGLLYFLRHFSLDISKSIHLHNANLEYLPTQSLSEYLAYHYQPKIDAIIYPSTQTNGKGKNIVILNHAAKLNYENNEDNYFSYVPNSLIKHTIKAIDYDIEDYDFNDILSSVFRVH